MSASKYGIWCTVSHGVTGSRSACLKSNGTPVTFDSLERADAEAARLNALANANPFTAYRAYRPVQLKEQPS